MGESPLYGHSSYQLNVIGRPSDFFLCMCVCVFERPIEKSSKVYMDYSLSFKH